MVVGSSSSHVDDEAVRKRIRLGIYEEGQRYAIFNFYLLFSHALFVNRIESERPPRVQDARPSQTNEKIRPNL